MKKHPQIIQEDNLKSALALQELNVDTDSEECRELTKKLKEFYFGCIKESVTPKLTYFLVIQIACATESIALSFHFLLHPRI